MVGIISGSGIIGGCLSESAFGTSHHSPSCFPLFLRFNFTPSPLPLLPLCRVILLSSRVLSLITCHLQLPTANFPPELLLFALHLYGGTYWWLVFWSYSFWVHGFISKVLISEKKRNLLHILQCGSSDGSIERGKGNDWVEAITILPIWRDPRERGIEFTSLWNEQESTRVSPLVVCLHTYIQMSSYIPQHPLSLSLFEYHNTRYISSILYSLQTIGQILWTCHMHCFEFNSLFFSNLKQKFFIQIKF